MYTYSIISDDPSILANFGRSDQVPLTCSQCGLTHTRAKHLIQSYISRGRKHAFCSNACSNRFTYGVVAKTMTCRNCEKPFARNDCRRKFCSSRCSASFNNKNKSHGTRRSKLEVWAELSLTRVYPDLTILFNDKTAIGSELDIYIPSLRLAFELNGIFHYEPVYGPDKLTSIISNDQQKFRLCHEAQISLCVIDTSSQKNFTEKSSAKFLSIMQDIIDEKLEAPVRLELTSC